MIRLHAALHFHRGTDIIYTEQGIFRGPGVSTSSVIQMQYGLTNDRTKFEEGVDKKVYSGWGGVFRFLANDNIGPMPFIRRPGVAIQIPSRLHEHRL